MPWLIPHIYMRCKGRAFLRLHNSEGYACEIYLIKWGPPSWRFDFWVPFSLSSSLLHKPSWSDPKPGNTISLVRVSSPYHCHVITHVQTPCASSSDLHPFLPSANAKHTRVPYPSLSSALSGWLINLRTLHLFYYYFL